MQVISIFFLYSFGILQQFLAIGSDPCLETIQLRLYREKYRGNLCKLRLGKGTSDRDIKEGWYKVNGIDSPLQMPTKPVPIYSCSTVSPGWMNGTHPSVEEEEAERTICFSSQLDPCHYSVNIFVKNCSDYFVYNLMPTISNSHGYCFGDNITCPPIDPCEDIDRKEDMIDDGYRSPICPVTNISRHENITEGWYRLLSHDERFTLSLLSSCPEPMRCGAVNPLWLNDSYPAEYEEIVSRTVCVRTTNSCCENSFQIDIKNCSTYYSFKLVSVPQQNQRYCFDDGICRETTTKTVYSTSTYGLNTVNTATGQRTKTADPNSAILPASLATVIVLIILVASAVVYTYIMKKKRLSSSVSDIRLVGK